MNWRDKKSIPNKTSVRRVRAGRKKTLVMTFFLSLLHPICKCASKSSQSQDSLPKAVVLQTGDSLETWFLLQHSLKVHIGTCVVTNSEEIFLDGTCGIVFTAIKLPSLTNSGTYSRLLCRSGNLLQSLLRDSNSVEWCRMHQ